MAALPGPRLKPGVRACSGSGGLFVNPRLKPEVRNMSGISGGLSPRIPSVAASVISEWPYLAALA